MVAYRNPKPSELRLVRALIRAAHLNNVDLAWIDAIRVEALADGAMGSFRIHAEGSIGERRRTGRCAAELQFDDADGIPVLASLYLDSAGLPYEVDIWKANFQPGARVPSEL